MVFELIEYVPKPYTFYFLDYLLSVLIITYRLNNYQYHDHKPFLVQFIDFMFVYGLPTLSIITIIVTFKSLVETHSGWHFFIAFYFTISNQLNFGTQIILFMRGVGNRSKLYLAYTVQRAAGKWYNIFAEDKIKDGDEPMVSMFAYKR